MAEESVETGEQCSMVAAIKSKYDQKSLNAYTHIYVPAKGPGKTVSGDITVPPILALDHRNIETAGSPDEIQSMCGHVTELDLTGNNVTDWKEVLKMIQSIPKLKFLNLTSNKLDNDSLSDGTTIPSFTNVQNLSLNKTDASWEIISQLLKIFPSLTELHLSLNSHGCIRLPDNLMYPSLTKLHFNGHCIQKFDDLCCLGHLFPTLKHFVSIESELQTLETSEENYGFFQNMKYLNISSSKLISWDDVDRLRKFVSLTDVRLLSIPFLESFEAKERRQLVIARLPNIQQLNGSGISSNEREDAERAFIRYYMDRGDKPNRYHELEEAYGKLDPLVEVNLQPEKYINLKIKFEEKEEFMLIDPKQTVKEFKKFLQNFVGLPPSKFTVTYVDSLDGLVHTHNELRYLGRKLHSYSIKEGDEFLIYPK